MRGAQDCNKPMLCSPVRRGELEGWERWVPERVGALGTAPKLCCRVKVRVGARRRDPSNVGELGGVPEGDIWRGLGEYTPPSTGEEAVWG